MSASMASNNNTAAASMASSVTTNTSNSNKDECVVIVCPFSTGEVLAQRARDMGYKLVLVFMAPKAEGGVLSCTIEGDFEVFHQGSVADTAAVLKALPARVVLVQPGAENGVCLSDSLAHALGLTHNTHALSAARRSKFLMGETIAAAGVPAARQHISTEWESVEQFLVDWNPNPFKVIVKPNASAGSDDVFKCESIEEVRAAFDCINGAINEFGEVNEGVLVMEFLEGQEYVVDAVSRDGEHKVVTIWKYDKRSCNGQFNVYFGMEVCAVESELEMELVAYNAMVLDALHISHGPSHAEIILTRDGPRLVEVGARCHGAHGSWIPLVNASFGANQVDATLDSFLRPERFAALPPFPVNRKAFAREAFLPSSIEGHVRSVPGKARVEALPSFFNHLIDVREGDRLHKTIDLFTMPGRVSLIGDEQEQVQRDYDLCHSLMAEGEFFELASGKAITYAEEAGPEEDC